MGVNWFVPIAHYTKFWHSFHELPFGLDLWRILILFPTGWTRLLSGPLPEHCSLIIVIVIVILILLMRIRLVLLAWLKLFLFIVIAMMLRSLVLHRIFVSVVMVMWSVVMRLAWIVWVRMMARRVVSRLLLVRLLVIALVAIRVILRRVFSIRLMILP